MFLDNFLGKKILAFGKTGPKREAFLKILLILLPMLFSKVICSFLSLSCIVYHFLYSLFFFFANLVVKMINNLHVHFFIIGTKVYHSRINLVGTSNWKFMTAHLILCITMWDTLYNMWLYVCFFRGNFHTPWLSHLSDRGVDCHLLLCLLMPLTWSLTLLL